MNTCERCGVEIPEDWDLCEACKARKERIDFEDWEEEEDFILVEDEEED